MAAMLELLPQILQAPVYYVFVSFCFLAGVATAAAMGTLLGVTASKIIGEIYEPLQAARFEVSVLCAAIYGIVQLIMCGGNADDNAKMKAAERQTLGYQIAQELLGLALFTAGLLIIMKVSTVCWKCFSALKATKVEASRKSL